MSVIITHTPESFSQVMEVVESFQDKHDSSWYRGMGDASYKLTPTIFRHPKESNIEKIHQIENDLASVFEQRSPPFVSQAFGDEWEQMFFMQHYGIPTRLLDWTESPFIALYFALTASERTAKGKPKTTPHFGCWIPLHGTKVH